MIQSRVEFLAGHRWAEQVTRSSLPLLKVKGGKLRLLKTLESGMKEKPESYAEAVRVWVEAVSKADPSDVLKATVN